MATHTNDHAAHDSTQAPGGDKSGRPPNVKGHMRKKYTRFLDTEISLEGLSEPLRPFVASLSKGERAAVHVLVDLASSYLSYVALKDEAIEVLNGRERKVDALKTNARALFTHFQARWIQLIELAQYIACTAHPIRVQVKEFFFDELRKFELPEQSAASA